MMKDEDSDATRLMCGNAARVLPLGSRNADIEYRQLRGMGEGGRDEAAEEEKYISMLDGGRRGQVGGQAGGVNSGKEFNRIRGPWAKTVWREDEEKYPVQVPARRNDIVHTLISYPVGGAGAAPGKRAPSSRTTASSMEDANRAPLLNYTSK
ncbi:hypothetical protein THAOC_09659 [Thalassiosira oceanica]|uniref:Uncharacterized protein n=1 Tax=Thalassiosira oceanica TaxID=159749 RepID=K0SUM9_THAOC|nr:hypothetical protein THAOC_09659 [Thalassiosira oceanica]|eukprot:EJK69120.1 hypothetical protein THAOC_09659 [Thalassiosira oceanica]